MRELKKIAVIGAGFAGTAFCLAALQRGLDRRFEITLLEQSPNPGPVGAGVLLQPSGQFVLQKLGVLSEAIRKQLHPYQKLRARDGLGSLFLDLNVAEEGFQTYGAHRGTLFQALLEPVQKASQQGKLSLRLGQAVERVSPEGGRWNLGTLSEELGSYDLVVVADGNRSRTRSKFGFRCLQRAYRIGALWYVGKSATPHGELLQSCQGTSRIVGLLPTDREQSVSFFYSCSTEEYHQLLGSPFDRFLEQVCSIAPEAEALLQSAGGFEDMLHTKYFHGWMPTWTKDGAVVIGDAAHPMSPHLGQGINLALLDAYSLAKSLEVEEFPQAPWRYQSKRQGQVAVNSWLSLILTPFFQSTPDLGQGRLRNLGVRLFTAWPWMRRQMQGAVWGRKAALTDLVHNFEDVC